jgi:hypothetical protein
MRTIGRAMLRVLRVAATLLAALVLLVEEWGWRPLTALAARAARWSAIARLEARIARASPRVALLLFAVPAVLLFPVKLLALWLLQGPQAWLGVALIVGAKVLGTALVGRLFVVCEPQLMTFPWFARALGWWRVTKLRLRASVERWTSWPGVRVLRRRVGPATRRAGRRVRRAWRGVASDIRSRSPPRWWRRLVARRYDR